jgi:hypothetical protein
MVSSPVAFSWHRMVSSRRTCYQLQASSEVERRDWMASLRAAIDAHEDKPVLLGNHRHCFTLFNTLIFCVYHRI